MCINLSILICFNLDIVSVMCKVKSLLHWWDNLKRIKVLPHCYSTRSFVNRNLRRAINHGVGREI